MIHCTRTNSENEDFRKLVCELDAYLKILDGEEHLFYASYNKTANLKYVIVAYDDETPVACGAMKAYSGDTMEVKRMYVLPNQRGKGTALAILKELDQWAIELNYQKCLLETGKRQPEAISLYKKNGYQLIPNFGQYANNENSVCFEKVLKKTL